jgi:flagellar protein FliS
MDPTAAYKDNAVTTQSRGRLIVLLYDGAIKFLKQAIAELQADHYAQKGEYIGKAMAIIDELDASLNMEAAEDMGMNLRKIYDFMRRHLLQASLKRDPQMIRDVIALLEDLNEGWKAITT